MLSSRVKELKKNGALYTMILPGVLTLIVFNYLPMFGITIAFKNFNYSKGLFGSPWAGFKNFEFLFKSNDAFLITRNTILYNLVFIVLGTAGAVLVAVALSEMKQHFLAKASQTALLLPYFLSWVVVSYVGYAFLGTDKGAINLQILKPLGLSPVNWYFEVGAWPFILTFFHLWKTVGYSSIIYLAAITGINDEYYEAAVLDGASKWKQIRHITLPLIMPQIVMMVLLSIGRIFYADFGLFYQLPRNSGTLYPVTNVIDTYIYNGLSATGNIGMSSAAGLYQAFVGFVLVLGSNLLVKRLDPDKALF